MTTTRILPGVLLLVATAGPAAAQSGTGDAPYSLTRTGEAPKSLPTLGLDGNIGTSSGMPLGALSVNPHPVDRLTSTMQPDVGQTPPAYDPMGPTITLQPEHPVVPPGAYPSPYFTDGPGCCGPMCANGRIGYELYSSTGPTWSFGEGRFARELNPGWMVGGGGRSLFFNPEHDAAWILDLGISYQFNGGSRDHFTDLILHQAPLRNPLTGQTTPRPDVLSPAAIRGLDRTNFNFAIGRDWWIWGPGATGLENSWNLRIGGIVGGRWGSAHVDLLPQDTALGDYQRRQGVTHGVFIAPHATIEVPMGASIWFGGLQFEWGYDWMNLVPPINGNLHNFNLLMTAGVRF